MKASKQPQKGRALAKAAAEWLEQDRTAILRQAQIIIDRINRELETPSGKGWLRVHELLEQAQRDPVIIASPSATEFIEVLLELTGDLPFTTAEAAFARLDGVLPLGALGAKFKAGRKLTSTSPLRRAVRRTLKYWPEASATQVWTALADYPPAGLVFCENRYGRYVERTGHQDTSYRRFQNIVSEERQRKPRKK